ncbi:MAG: peptidase T [Alistipes sp.]|jgi:tripeptide aminopeptidase|nr:peptidase T [Alistipes sp.]
MKLLDRFIKYVLIDTQSDPTVDCFPSTPGQSLLLRSLADELIALGAADVEMDTHGYVMATIPATPGCENEPTIGFLAHVDTSPDAPGNAVRPRLTERDGDIIITSDGTTLLGADDKAGVAEIMTAAEILLSKDPSTLSVELWSLPTLTQDLRHGKIRIAFTPDEEIGSGVDHFDVEAFGADFAYTVDGGAEGELEYENFNAAGVKVTIRGLSAHPGDARNKMINALGVGVAFDNAIPRSQRPETTEGYEGFYHLLRMEGNVSEAHMEYIVRDHDRGRFEGRKKNLADIAGRLESEYGYGTVRLTVNDQYYNMREVIERHPEVVERAKRAMLAAEVTPVVKPIRGGTDGARLSFMGLPCPNIFAGGIDFHSLSESVSLRSMGKAVRTIVEIVRV